jgi:hypothetical protein
MKASARFRKLQLRGHRCSYGTLHPETRRCMVTQNPAATVSTASRNGWPAWPRPASATITALIAAGVTALRASRGLARCQTYLRLLMISIHDAEKYFLLKSLAGGSDILAAQHALQFAAKSAAICERDWRSQKG